MIIQDPKIGGIDPNSCHPNPRPTTLAFFGHILISVPKTKVGCHLEDWLKYYKTKSQKWKCGGILVGWPFTKETEKKWRIVEVWGSLGGVKRGLLDLYWTLFAPLVRHQIWFQTPYNSPTGQYLQGGITDPFLDWNSFPRTSKRCSGQRSVQRSFIRDSGGPHSQQYTTHDIPSSQEQFHQVYSFSTE